MILNRVLVLAAMAVAAASALQIGPAVVHAEPTCGGLGGIQNHGQHVVGDYVTGLGGIGGGLDWPPAGQVGGGGGAALPGGPGAHGHLLSGVAPGASFCLAQSQAPGFHLP